MLRGLRTGTAEVLPTPARVATRAADTREGRGVDSDEQLRGGEVEDQRADCRGDEDAGRVQRGERTLDATEPGRPRHARDHCRIGRLRCGVQELRQRDHHEDRPDEPAVSKHDNRCCEHTLNDGARRSDARRTVAIGKRTTREWPYQSWCDARQHVNGRTNRGMRQAVEQHEECHRREPVTVERDACGTQQPNRRAQRASRCARSAGGRIRRSFQRRFLFGVLDRDASVREQGPTRGRMRRIAHPVARRVGPLRDNDAIDPLSGCHEITQWFVTEAPYSGERLTPGFDIAPSSHGISLKLRRR